MRKTKGPRARVGDIIEVALPEMKFAYLQMRAPHEDRLLGRWVDVLDVLLMPGFRRTLDAASIPEPIYSFLALTRILLEDERFTVVAHGPVSKKKIVLRRAFFGGWILLEPTSERFVKVLSESEAEFPIEEGLPAAVVVERLLSNWRPHDERRTVDEILRANRQRADHGNPFGVVYFAEFPTEDLLGKASRELEQSGFPVEKLERDEDDEVPEWELRMQLTAESRDALSKSEIVVAAIICRHQGTVVSMERPL